jgi:hypothetical protein
MPFGAFPSRELTSKVCDEQECRRVRRSLHGEQPQRSGRILAGQQPEQELTQAGDGCGPPLWFELSDEIAARPDRDSIRGGKAAGGLLTVTRRQLIDQLSDDSDCVVPFELNTAGQEVFERQAIDLGLCRRDNWPANRSIVEEDHLAGRRRWRPVEVLRSRLRGGRRFGRAN